MKIGTQYDYRARRRLVLLWINLCVLYWTVESIVHTYFYHTGNLLENLFPTPMENEFWMRVMVLIILGLFGTYANYSIKSSYQVENAHHTVEAHLGALTVSSKDGIAYANPDGGRIQKVNDSFLKMTGYTSEDLVGEKSFQDITPEEFHDHDARKIEELLQTEEPQEYEKEYIRKDGSPVPVLVTIFLLKRSDGSPLSLAAMVKDITECKRTEAIIRESEERFRRTFEQAAVGIAHVGPDGTFILLNQRFCDITGYTQDELLKLTFKEITHPEDLDAILVNVEQLLAGDIETFSMEKRYFRKDGGLVWVTLTVSLVSQPSGEPNYFIAVIEDITEHKQAEEALRKSEERVWTFIENIDDMVYFQGLDGSLSMLNAASAAITGYSLEAFAENPQLWQEIIHPEDLKIAERFFAEYPDGKPSFEVEYRLKSKNGDWKWIQSRMVGVTDGEDRYIGYNCIDRDITRRKQADEELRRYADELERSNRDLGQFAYAASHDLQEPLRNVSNFVGLLAKKYQGKLDADADEFISYVLDGTNRMQEMIRGMLTYSRVGTTGSQFEPVDCEQVIADITASLKLLITEHETELTHGTLPTVLADRVQIEQVFQNLIDNAIKFHGPDPPRIDLKAERSGSEWIFSVADNGIGIESEFIEKVFEMFQRLHSRKQYSGNGIGLALCQRIIGRHGGRIWAESNLGSGSTFYFTLPAHKA
ncbi:MAG: PAS domain S-box protein [Candidatus Neomarinimicrobiota bacterium]